MTDWRVFPKVELHLHLDCSLSYELVRRLEPSCSLAAYRQRFVGPSCGGDLRAYLRVAEAGIALMQTAERLRMVTADVVRQLAGDGVVYCELRFAPLEHLREGLDPAEVVRQVAETYAAECGRFGLRGGLILCTQRHYTAAQSMMTARLARDFSDAGVVGFDIAGDEAGYGLGAHVAAFEWAQSEGICCTAHAGEACGAASVRETLGRLGVRRIGHGVRSAEDPDLLRQLRDDDIHLEVCPTSNLQTGVYGRIAEHSIDRLRESGVSLSVNTDSRAISDTTLSREFGLLEETFGWTREVFYNTSLEAVRRAFTDESTRELLRQRLRDAWHPEA